MAQKIDMLNGGLFKKIVLFAVPIMLQGLLQSIYNSADLVVVGQFSSGAALSAVGTTTSVYNVLLGLFFGIAVGVDVVSSYTHGAGDKKGLKKIIDTSVISAPIMGIIVAIIGAIIAEPVLILMNTPTTNGVLELATLYLRILMIGVPFSLVFNFSAAILRTSGETQKPFIYLVISGLVNVILNLIFVAGLGWGVVGVAIATVISQMLSAALILIRLMRNEGIFSFSFKNIEFSFQMLGKIVKVGIPAGIQSCAFSLSNVFLQSGVNSFGPDAMEGSTAVGTIEGLMWVTLVAFQNSATTFVSQNIGAGKLKRARKAYRYSILCVAVLGIFLGLTMFLLSDFILKIFIPDNQLAMQYAYERYRITFPVYFLAGIMGTMPGGIRGMGDSLTPSIISIVGTCGIRILWVYTIFEKYNTMSILYLVHPITWVITCVSLLINYIVVLHFCKKRMPKEASNNESTPIKIKE